MTAEEKGKAFEKLRTIRKEKKKLEIDSIIIDKLEFKTETKLYLGRNESNDRIGYINLDAYDVVPTYEWLDKYNFDDLLHVSIESSFNIHKFLIVLGFFKNIGYEFSNRLQYGYNFIRVYEKPE